MRDLRIPGAALLGAALLAFAAPAGLAATPAGPSATVNPTTAKPGQSVALTLRNCKNPSQGGRAEGAVIGKGTTARSPIEATDLKPGPKGALVATATISSGARWQGGHPLRLRVQARRRGHGDHHRRLGGGQVRDTASQVAVGAVSIAPSADAVLNDRRS